MQAVAQRIQQGRRRINGQTVIGTVDDQVDIKAARWCEGVGPGYPCATSRPALRERPHCRAFPRASPPNFVSSAAGDQPPPHAVLPGSSADTTPSSSAVSRSSSQTQPRTSRAALPPELQGHSSAALRPGTIALVHQAAAGNQRPRTHLAGHGRLWSGENRLLPVINKVPYKFLIFFTPDYGLFQ